MYDEQSIKNAWYFFFFSTDNTEITYSKTNCLEKHILVISQCWK